MSGKGIYVKERKLQRASRRGAEMTKIGRSMRVLPIRGLSDEDNEEIRLALERAILEKKEKERFIFSQILRQNGVGPTLKAISDFDPRKKYSPSSGFLRKANSILALTDLRLAWVQNKIGSQVQWRIEVRHKSKRRFKGIEKDNSYPLDLSLSISADCPSDKELQLFYDYCSGGGDRVNQPKRGEVDSIRLHVRTCNKCVEKLGI